MFLLVPQVVQKNCPVDSSNKQLLLHMHDIHGPAVVLCEVRLQTCLHSCVNASEASAAWTWIISGFCVHQDSA